MERQERREAIERYRRFLDGPLKQRLEEVLKRRDGVYELQAQYQQLLQQVDSLRRHGTRDVQTRMNLGSDFFAQAVVPDASHLFVSVGLGFHVELTLDETEAFVARKDEQLAAVAGHLTERATEVGADLQHAYETLRELVRLEEEEQAAGRQQPQQQRQRGGARQHV